MVAAITGESGGVGVAMVWYVAYGSNKVPERLACYLRGGRPEGSRRTYHGARNRDLPVRSTRVEVPHRMFFAGHSPVWGGGVAFVDPRHSPAHATAAVAWLITLEQLADLVVQECGDEAPGPPLDGLPGPGDTAVVIEGRYDLLVGLAPIDGVPAVLVTSSTAPEPSEPSPAYLAMIELG